VNNIKVKPVNLTPYYYSHDTNPLVKYKTCKQIGYVKRIKKVGWGIQYTIEAATGIKYPCGIEIKGQKTHYNTGCVYLEDTRSIGQETLIKRFENEPKSRTVATVSINSGRETNESTSDSKLLGGDAAKDNRNNTNTRSKRSSTKMASTSSIAGNSKGTTRKRTTSKNSELDDAIQKQRDFLNGFVKKD
jgi:hypothetical protein